MLHVFITPADLHMVVILTLINVYMYNDTMTRRDSHLLMSHYSEDRRKLAGLFHRINNSEVLQNYISDICRDCEILLYIFSMDCVQKMQKAHEAADDACSDPLLYHSVLVHFFDSKKCKRVHIIHSVQSMCESMLILRNGNVRERCELLTKILKDHNRFTFLRWLVTCSTSIMPNFIDMSSLRALKAHLSSHNIEPPCFVLTTDRIIFDKSQITLRCSSLKPVACESRILNERILRSHSEITHVHMNPRAFVPTLSEREKKSKFSKKSPRYVNGYMKWRIHEDSGFVKDAMLHKREVVAGISGHSEYLFCLTRLFTCFDARKTTLLNCLWLVPAHHHSAYEVLLTSSAYGVKYDPTIDPIAFMSDLLNKVELDSKRACHKNI